MKNARIVLYPHGPIHGSIGNVKVIIKDNQSDNQSILNCENPKIGKSEKQKCYQSDNQNNGNTEDQSSLIRECFWFHESHAFGHWFLALVNPSVFGGRVTLHV